MIEILAKIEAQLRPIINTLLAPKLSVTLYSRARLKFGHKLAASAPREIYKPSSEFARELWGIKFQSPIFNAAGMYKNAEGYQLAVAQGAGAYLAGTSTANPRAGNEKTGIYLPFVPYPRSSAASNWLGLPNDGDEQIALRIKSLKKVPGVPVGISLMGSPDFSGEQKLESLVKGLRLFQDSGADFIELNESCPNTAHTSPQNDDLANRLKYISDNFLRTRHRDIPVIAKFSTDTEVSQVEPLLKLLLDLNFDGVNFGNSSVNYALHRNKVSKKELALYDYFTSTFGGGVTGRPLKVPSLELLRAAKQALSTIPTKREFHLIRTGGIETSEDVAISLEAGTSLMQWYTAYFENFSKNGHDIYKQLLESCAN